MVQIFGLTKSLRPVRPIRVIILSAFWLVIMNTAGAQTTWKITGSSIVFTVKQLGITIDGTFKGTTGNLRFDPAAPPTGSLSAMVEVRTINTGNSLRDRHLREREMFFNAGQYPNLRMKSTRVETSGKGYIGSFDLTIKDITKSVRVPFTFETTGQNGTFAGSFDINRRDWNLGGNTIGLADRVTVRINVQAQPQ